MSIFISFLSEQHLATKDLAQIYAVAYSKFCQCRIGLSAGGLDTSVAVDNAG